MTQNILRMKKKLLILFGGALLFSCSPSVENFNAEYQDLEKQLQELKEKSHAAEREGQQIQDEIRKLNNLIEVKEKKASWQTDRIKQLEEDVEEILKAKEDQTPMKRTVF